MELDPIVVRLSGSPVCRDEGGYQPLQ